MMVRGLLTYTSRYNNRQICIFFKDVVKLVHLVENDRCIYAYENPRFYGLFSFT